MGDLRRGDAGHSSLRTPNTGRSQCSLGQSQRWPQRWSNPAPLPGGQGLGKLSQVPLVSRDLCGGHAIAQMGQTCYPTTQRRLDSAAGACGIQESKAGDDGGGTLGTTGEPTKPNQCPNSWGFHHNPKTQQSIPHPPPPRQPVPVCSVDLFGSSRQGTFSQWCQNTFLFKSPQYSSSIQT